MSCVKTWILSGWIALALFGQGGEERIARVQKTERAFVGKYVSTKTPGTYECAACRAVLFLSSDKYQIGCGWPTFTQPAHSNSVHYFEDWSMGFKRYEVLCRGCDSFLGHVFHDGPLPKRLRYTIHSSALEFVTQ